MLWIRGRPGTTVPQGRSLQYLTRQYLAPLIQAGYTFWMVTRPPRLPRGLSVEDMAEDYARVIEEELAGHVDLLLGEAFGGFIAQQLAAAHPDTLESLALVNTAAAISDWGKDVDTRMASALLDGDMRAAGAAGAEAVIPGWPLTLARRVLGPSLLRALLSGCPAADFAVELEAEVAFDARPFLGRIAAPTLLICGDRDPYFPPTLVDETAAMIPLCDLRWYNGYGFLRSRFTNRFVNDIVAFSSSGPTSP